MWTWFSEPFGTDAANANPAGMGTFAYNIRFAGQVFDGQAGLHYNYYRDYDPATAKYWESDPLGLKAGVNTYAYVRDNPEAYNDPTGLQAASTGNAMATATLCPSLLTPTRAPGNVRELTKSPISRMRRRNGDRVYATANRHTMFRQTQKTRYRDVTQRTGTRLNARPFERKMRVSRGWRESADARMPRTLAVTELRME